MYLENKVVVHDGNVYGGHESSKRSVSESAHRCVALSVHCWVSMSKHERLLLSLHSQARCLVKHFSHIDTVHHMDFSPSKGWVLTTPNPSSEKVNIVLETVACRC